MFLEKIKSEGLAYLSYILGDGGKAAVIDPRRDCGISQEIAGRDGCRIRKGDKKQPAKKNDMARIRN